MMGKTETEAKKVKEGNEGGNLRFQNKEIKK